MSPQILSLIVFSENIHLNLNRPTKIAVCAPGFRLSNKAGGGQGGGIPCSILVSVFSDSCSGCSGGFVPVVSFRLFRVLVHARNSKYFVYIELTLEIQRIICR
jgi:hypothetical protein